MRCLLVACMALQASAQEGEGRPGARGLLKRGLLAKNKPTTTTTPAPQQADYEYAEEYESGAEAEAAPEVTSEAPPSSTESKKLVGSGVRPFRSNTDLLEALKRRRAQVAEAKHQGHTQQSSTTPEPAAPTQAPAKSSFSGKKRYSAPSRGENTNDELAPAPAAKPSRNRFSRPSARSVQSEPEVEEQNEAVQTRSSRTFARRGGN